MFNQRLMKSCNRTERKIAEKGRSSFVDGGVEVRMVWASPLPSPTMHRTLSVRIAYSTHISALTILCPSRMNIHEKSRAVLASG